MRSPRALPICLWFPKWIRLKLSLDQRKRIFSPANFQTGALPRIPDNQLFFNFMIKLLHLI